MMATSLLLLVLQLRYLEDNSNLKSIIEMLYFRQNDDLLQIGPDPDQFAINRSGSGPSCSLALRKIVKSGVLVMISLELLVWFGPEMKNDCYLYL